jgi:hypothetical protein
MQVTLEQRALSWLLSKGQRVIKEILGHKVFRDCKGYKALKETREIQVLLELKGLKAYKGHRVCKALQYHYGLVLRLNTTPSLKMLTHCTSSFRLC